MRFYSSGGQLSNLECSLRLFEKGDALDFLTVSAAIDCLLEVHAVFRYYYQCLFVVAKRADLFTLGWDAELFDRAVAKRIPVENPFEEPANKISKQD